MNPEEASALENLKYYLIELIRVQDRNSRPAYNWDCCESASAVPNRSNLDINWPNSRTYITFQRIVFVDSFVTSFIEWTLSLIRLQVSAVRIRCPPILMC